MLRYFVSAACGRAARSARLGLAGGVSLSDITPVPAAHDLRASPVEFVINLGSLTTDGLCLS